MSNFKMFIFINLQKDKFHRKNFPVNGIISESLKWKFVTPVETLLRLENLRKILKLAFLFARHYL